MKWVIIGVLLIFFTSSKAQFCVAVNCPHTLRYPEVTDTLLSIANDSLQSMQWSVVSGSATLDSVVSAKTVARGFSKSGQYIFLLTATSASGVVAKAYDTVMYSGKVATAPPVAITGGYSIDSVDTFILSGSGSFDPGGLAITFNWVQVSGPIAATVNTNTMANPLLSNLKNGFYVFRLTVTNSSGLTSSAIQSFTVNVSGGPIIKTVTTVTTFYQNGSIKSTTVTVP